MTQDNEYPRKVLNQKGDRHAGCRVNERRAQETIEGLRAEVKRLEGRLLRHEGTFITEALVCGHDLENWCDRCETCGHCTDANKDPTPETPRDAE